MQLQIILILVPDKLKVILEFLKQMYPALLNVLHILRIITPGTAGGRFSKSYTVLSVGTAKIADRSDPFKDIFAGVSRRRMHSFILYCISRSYNLSVVPKLCFGILCELLCISWSTKVSGPNTGLLNFREITSLTPKNLYALCFYVPRQVY
jgi:hypothetical protein